MQIAGPVLGLTSDLNDPAFSQVALRSFQRLGAAQPVVVIRLSVFKLEALEGRKPLSAVTLRARSIRDPVHQLVKRLEARLFGRVMFGVSVARHW